MSTAMEQYRKAKEALEAAKETMRQTAKDAFTEQSKPLFEKYPSILSISWAQYTPHFNDGDPCTFGCHNDYPSVKFANQPDAEDDDDSRWGNEVGSWDIQRDREAGRTELADTKQAILDFAKAFTDDTYEEMFGDGVRVIVTADGVDTEEYDHD